MDRPMPDEGRAARELLQGFSLEMTAKDVEGIRDAAPLIPQGTRVNITFLGTEELAMRVDAAAAVRELGLVPVPHIAARRLPSADALDAYLRGLSAAHAVGHLCLIGGDPSTPEGPFDSALSVIRSGALARHGVREVAIAGYPEGHPDIPEATLWEHLDLKLSALREQGMDAVITTQFSFDADAVARWVVAVRERGITVPIRIGVPGPAGVKRLLGFARRFGIGANALIVRKYGFSLTSLMGKAGPDRFIRDLAHALDQQLKDPRVGLHFYTFGGLVATAEWIHHFTEASGDSLDAAANT